MPAGPAGGGSGGPAGGGSGAGSGSGEPAGGGSGGPAGGGSGEPAGGGQPEVNELYAPGTNIVDRATLVAGGWTILKEPPAHVASHMLLIARKTMQNKFSLKTKARMHLWMPGHSWVKVGPASSSH